MDDLNHVHVIPVDASLTPEEAWREICIMGFRSTDTGSEAWAVVHCDAEECASIQHADTPTWLVYPITICEGETPSDCDASSSDGRCDTCGKAKP